jgi:hypothetical protein
VQEVTGMTLQEIIADIHVLNEDFEAYGRKYGVLSETFYECIQAVKSRRMMPGC